MHKKYKKTSPNWKEKRKKQNKWDEKKGLKLKKLRKEAVSISVHANQLMKNKTASMTCWWVWQKMTRENNLCY